MSDLSSPSVPLLPPESLSPTLALAPRRTNEERPARPARLSALYAAEACCALSGTLLTIGLPFCAAHRFGWGARENFVLATCQGTLYVAGALSAQRLSKPWGRSGALLRFLGSMVLLGAAMALSAARNLPLTTAVLVVLETGVMGASWPMIESLVSAAGPKARLSQRLGTYNLVWAAFGAMVLAASGAIIQHAPVWAFFGIAASTHLLASLSLLLGTWSPRSSASVATREMDSGSAAERPAPGRSRERILALRLSRIALPSTYVVIYALAPALPSLHAMRQLSPTYATMVASVWMAARTLIFLVMARTTFWHRRPLLLLWAAALMLVAFAGIAVPSSLPGMALWQALSAMVAAQILLGGAIGVIYAASLYFGMAVSDGSTEHGGYHEALIGLGLILGPAIGAISQWIHPGQTGPGLATVGVLLSFTLVAAAIVRSRAMRTSVHGSPNSAL